jgi:transposase
VMLGGLDEGQYRVTKISDYHGSPTYTFARRRGRKNVCRHYVDSIDPFLKPPGCPDLNRIEFTKAASSF